MASLSQEEENYVRMSLLLTEISPHAVRVSFDSEFYPLCLDTSIKKEYNQLATLRKKRILSKSQGDLLFPRDGGLYSSKFDLTLMVTLLQNLTNINLNLEDTLQMVTDISPPADLARLIYYRNHFLHYKDGKMDSSFFSTAWNDMVGAGERLGGQKMLSECKELRIKLLEESDVPLNLRVQNSQKFEKWKMYDSECFETGAFKNKLCSMETLLICNSGMSRCEKSTLVNQMRTTIANEGYVIPPVTNPEDIYMFYNLKKKVAIELPLKEIRQSTESALLFYFKNYISQNEYGSKFRTLNGTEWKDSLGAVGGLVDQNSLGQCRGLKTYYSEQFRLSLIEQNIRRINSFFKQRGGNLTHLDDRKAENSSIMKMCTYNKTKQNHFNLLKPMFQQRNCDACFIASYDETRELFKIKFRHVLGLQTFPLEKIATYRHLRNTRTQDSYVEIRRDEHILHNEDKIKELKKYYNNADLTWKENHILLERVVKIKKYCDQLFAFVTSSVHYSEDQKCWLEILTEDLLNTAFKRIFELLATSDGSDGLCSEPLAVVNDDDEVSGVSVKIGDEALEEQYHFSKQQLIECQMCIDQNNALYWCNNCRMNICSFCKMYHETVWTVMNHEVYPLHLLS